nr:substrate-binding domain-containing protein [Planctomycetota bacterium]
NQIVVAGGKSLDAVIVYRANTAQVKDKVAVVNIDHPAALASQPIAISRISNRSQLARRFVAKILSPASQERFEKVGFRWHPGGKEGGE